VRQPLVKFLQMRQYRVVTAETADEGLDAIRQHRPDAAIIDLRLKRGSGREVVVSMPPDVPVIIFSGLRSESADLEVIRPQTRLVEKPYSLIMLMDTLEDMLEQSRAQYGAPSARRQPPGRGPDGRRRFAPTQSGGAGHRSERLALGIPA
jgi:DNA-binding response OmpR family regulator